MTLQISTVLDSKIKKFLKEENAKFISFLEDLKVSLEMFQENPQYYIDLYKEDEEKKKKLIAILFLLVVEALVTQIEQELKRLGVYSEALLAQIENSLVEGTSSILTSFESMTSDVIVDTYTRLLKNVLNSDGTFTTLDEFLAKYSEVVDKFSDFYSVQLNNALFVKLEDKFFKDLGLNIFIWGTMEDEKVRETHKERNSDSFYSDGTSVTDKEYSDGKEIVPKEEFNCRCFKKIPDAEFITAVTKKYLGGVS